MGTPARYQSTLGLGGNTWGHVSLATINVVALVYFACSRRGTADGLPEGAIVHKVVSARHISWSPLSGATIAPRAGKTKESKRLARVTLLAPGGAKPS
jgi:hypothetical protein